MEYNEQANGQQVEARLKEEFEVVLPEVRTAGYRWNIVEDGQPELQLSENTSQRNAGIGGAGQHRFHFRAVAAGRCEIKIQYARPWKEPAETARTFELKVRVQS